MTPSAAARYAPKYCPNSSIDGHEDDEQLERVHLDPKVALEHFISGRRRRRYLVRAARLADGEAEKHELGEREPDHDMNEWHEIPQSEAYWNRPEPDAPRVRTAPTVQ